MRVGYDPKRPDFTPYGFTCVRWTPSTMLRPDHHDEVELNLLPSGGITYLMGGERIVVPAKQLVMFWAAIPHQVIDLKISEPYYVATIPFSWFLQGGFSERDVQALLNGKVFVEGNSGRYKLDSLMFDQWIEDFETENTEAHRISLSEMESRILRLMFQDSSHTAPGTRTAHVIASGGLTKIEEMACFIARNYSSQLTIQEIANVVQLTPNYAMSLFKKGFGTTMIDYLSYHRISHAQRLLVTTDRKTIDICFDSGFGSLSQFNSVFKQRCGSTPKRYRELNRLY